MKKEINNLPHWICLIGTYISFAAGLLIVSLVFF